MKLYVTVFVPAYNEENNLSRCVQIILAKMDELGVQSEVLIVDDASQDGTGRLADHLASQEARVRVVHHTTNLGIGGAFQTAVRHASGEWLILIPADLAMAPDELSRFIQAAPHADIVVGLRSDLSDYNLIRKAIHYTNIFLIQHLFNVRLRQFQYISLYRLEVLRAIEIEHWRSAFFLAEILVKASVLGYRLVEVEIRYAPRIQGRATGAKLRLLLTTVWDVFSFWLHWRKQGRRVVSPQDVRRLVFSERDRVQKMNSTPEGRVWRPKRPFGVTIVTLGVLSMASLNLLRLISTLHQWEFLAELGGVSPAYVAMTGLLWTVVGGTWTWGLWRRADWAPVITRRVTIIFSLYLWLDRLLLQGWAWGQPLPPEWFFSALFNISIVGLVFWIFSRKNSRAYFGALHE